MPDKDPSAESRWAKATSRARGLEDLGLEAALRRYFLTYLPLTVAAALVVGFVLAFLWPEVAGGFVRSGLFFGSLLSGLGLVVVGMVYGSKRLSALVRPSRIGVTVGLTGEEAKHIRRQVLAKEPIDPKHITVLRGAAVQMREGLLAKQLLWSPGFLIYFAGQFLLRGTATVFDIVMNVLLLGMFVLLFFVARQFHQTGSFLTSTVALETSNAG